MRAAIAFVLGVTAAFSAGATAQAASGGLSLSGQWFRLVLRSLPAAGYFTLANASAVPRSLTGAASPACGSLTLHQSVQQGSEERMAMVPSVTVPAHGQVAFSPGGYHLMCMSPTAAMTPGQSVPVTLRFADGNSFLASFPVRGATGK